MELGVFAKTYLRPTLEETLDAVVQSGFSHVQFNMSTMGLATLPDRLDEGSCVWIGERFRERGLKMTAISGTFNMCDPADARIEHNLHRLDVLAGACRWLDTRIITLSTGSRDRDDMWKWHVANAAKSSWDRLVQTMQEAVKIADRHEVTLAFEPEMNNVVSSVMRARRLLDEIGSPWLKVVIDAVNLFPGGDSMQLQSLLHEVADWLGPDIVLAHAKSPPRIEKIPELDLPHLESIVEFNLGRDAADEFDELARTVLAEGDDDLRERAPRWLPFYAPYLSMLTRAGYHGPLVLHGMDEAEIQWAIGFLTLFLKRLGAAS